jgi:sugar/nucleoside kinase (ribokinase family)
VVNANEAKHIRAHAPKMFLSKTTIVTDGAAPIEALLGDGSIRQYPVEKFTPVVDPTGSGDAFTAGVVSQLLRDTTQPLTYLDAAIEAGTALARQCLSHHGAQPADLEP